MFPNRFCYPFVFARMTGRPVGIVANQPANAVQEYGDNFASPYKAAQLGYIDEIIKPEETRKKLIQALEMTQTKSKVNPAKKHGNIPL